MAVNAHIRMTEWIQIKNLLMHFKVLENQEKSKPKANTRKGTIKISAEINKIETKITQDQWIRELVLWKNKINKSLADLTKKRGKEETQINSSRNEKGKITTASSQTQKIITNNFENLYSYKMENSKEMDRFLDKYELPKLYQDWKFWLIQYQAVKLRKWWKPTVMV